MDRVRSTAFSRKDYQVFGIAKTDLRFQELRSGICLDRAVNRPYIGVRVRFPLAVGPLLRRPWVPGFCGGGGIFGRLDTLGSAWRSSGLLGGCRSACVIVCMTRLIFAASRVSRRDAKMCSLTREWGSASRSLARRIVGRAASGGCVARDDAP